MTTLYAIVGNWYSCGDEWETVEEIYQDNDDAELRVIELEERARELGNETSYYIREYKLK